MKTLALVASTASALMVAASAPGQVADWENPAVFERGQEPGHAPLASYASVEEALRHAPKAAPSTLVLNGAWRFHWSPTPEEAPEGFERPGFDVSGWDEIAVPGNWQMQGFGHPMFRNIAHPFPADPPRVPKGYNPTGSYRRDFELPAGWEGRRLLLHFEGVKSAAEFWLNGKPLGYNEGGMEPAEFDVTQRVRPGTNTLAVRVLRWSDGSYLEDQDMWRLSGIFRDVYLRAAPRVHVRDLYVTTDLDAAYRDAVLSVDAAVVNAGDAPIEAYRLRASLYRDGQRVGEPFPSEPLAIVPGRERRVAWSREVAAPKLWSAEDPNLYSLVVELLDAAGEVVEIVSTRIGFREVEVVEQALMVNGREVKLNAVNSHVHHPDTGRAMDVETMRRDLILMKRFNVNAVRTSHYPPNVEYLDLADELGVYVIDETNDEAHATEFLSERPEWREAYVHRAREMVLRDRNHPSIVLWSAGNESGSGDNICAVIAEGKRLDPSRPAWMYGGNNDYSPGNAPLDCEDVIGPRYPTPFELRTRIGSVPASMDPRPSFMDEYLAATGNGLGGLDEYWEVIRSCRRCIGGAVWDWVSPGVRWPWRVTPDASPHGNDGALMGRAQLVDGRFGRALDLSGHDEWLELYRDPSLDLTGDQLTLELWVQPRPWHGTGPLLTKGTHQFGLTQTDAATLEFYVHTGSRGAVSASVPDDWVGSWHHVAGVYDGRRLALWIDGTLVASVAHAGSMSDTPFPVNVGRNAALHGQEHPGELSNARFDRVRLYARALTAGELGADSDALRSEALLWLDFESVEQTAEYYSLGIGGRSYGVVWPDRTPQPELWQLKKSAQPVGIALVDAAARQVRVVNRHAFTDLASFDARWELTSDGVVTQEGRLDVALAAGESTTIAVPFAPPAAAPGVEHRLRVRFVLRDATPWAEAGHEIAWEEFDLPTPVAAPSPPDRAALPPLEIERSGGRIVVSGRGFAYAFDAGSGELVSLTFGGEELLRRGPRMNVWRAPLANERDDWGTYRGRLRTAHEGMGNDVANGWRALGLDRLEQRIDAVEVEHVGPAEVVVTVRGYALWGAAPPTSFGSGFDVSYTYRVLGSGDLLLTSAVVPEDVMPEWLPKTGLELVLAPGFETVAWYGRGPHETYPDRKTGARFGVYRSDVDDLWEPYLVPQDYGNRSDVRWMAVERADGIGLLASGEQPLEASARRHATENLSRASYPPQLVKQDGVTLSLDHRTSGVGGTAISVLRRYQVPPEPWAYTVRLRPYRADTEDPAALHRQELPG